MKSVYLQEDLNKLAGQLKQQRLSGCRVLVTGATGLIGSLCVKVCLQHNRICDNTIQVIGLARSPEKVRAVFADELDDSGELPSVSWVYQDVTENLPADIACDYIIHTASPTASKYFVTKPVEVLDSIYVGTKQLLELARRTHVKGFVYLSSMEAFGQTQGVERLAEQELGYIDLQKVRSCYSEGKRAAELLCKCYAQEYGVPVKIARLAQIFGAGVQASENRVFAQFARSALANEDIVLHTEGKSVGNYCYTADAVAAIFQLLVDGVNGDVYSVVNEETTRTIRELAQTAIETLSTGKSQLVFDIPEGDCYGYAPDTEMRISGAKMMALGWKPEVCLADMFRRMVPDLLGES